MSYKAKLVGIIGSLVFIASLVSALVLRSENAFTPNQEISFDIVFSSVMCLAGWLFYKLMTVPDTPKESITN